MKTIFKLSLTALVAAAALSSCQKSLYDQYKENASISPEYDASWIAKYGEVASDQSWDFSAALANKAAKIEVGPAIYVKNVNDVPSVETKGTYPGAEYAGEGLNPLFDESTVKKPLSVKSLQAIQTSNEEEDLAYIISVIGTTAEKDWTPKTYQTQDMWCWWVHNQTSDYQVYALGIHWFDPSTGSDYRHDLPILGCSENGWHYGMGHASYGYRINPEDLNGMDEVYWYAISSEDHTVIGDTDYDLFKQEFKLDKYKEIVTPTRATYWCFDCNHDGDYTDLICLLLPSEKEVSCCKRYLIEDLGSTGDFDFNDIVVDVYKERSYPNTYGDNEGWEQKAYVRTLGGTIDFRLTIGNTEWVKSTAGFNSGSIYNSFNPDYDNVLAEFPVEGWDPDTNNISVKVGNTSSESVKTIKFPKTGAIPMIIAFSVDQKWQSETVSIPSEWFTTE